MLSRAFCFLCICLHLCACTSLRLIKGDAVAKVNPGDSLQVVMRDQRELALVVDRVDANRICSTDQCIAMDQVAAVEVREVDGWKTAGLVTLFLVLAFGIAAAASGPGMLLTAPAMAW